MRGGNQSYPLFHAYEFQVLGEEELSESPLLVFANKQDIPGCVVADYTGHRR